MRGRKGISPYCRMEFELMYREPVCYILDVNVHIFIDGLEG